MTRGGERFERVGRRDTLLERTTHPMWVPLVVGNQSHKSKVVHPTVQRYCRGRTVIQAARG